LFQSKGIAKMREVAQSGATVIFVSHNLGAVAGLCSRSLLLKNGSLLQDGPTPDIIRTYMQQISATRTISADKAVMVESLVLSDGNGPRLNFNAGEQMHVDIKLRANQPVRNISCVLYIKDKQYYTVFNISPDRLGLGFLTLDAGETCTYRFNLKLDLAPGAFHACVSLLQHQTSNSLDVVEPAATFLVDSPVEVGGAANLYPTATLARSERDEQRSGKAVRAAG
jgi:lipopolysaccharide transport system ATP-binding protein